MPNVLMIPAIVSGTLTTKINGRSYSCAFGATISVPDFDANELAANGWINSGFAAGTTAARPAAPVVGTQYNDTTVGAMVVCVGKGPSGPVWVHHATGSTA